MWLIKRLTRISETSAVNEAHNHSTTSPSESIFERNNYAQKQVKNVEY